MVATEKGQGGVVPIGLFHGFWGAVAVESTQVESAIHLEGVDGTVTYEVVHAIIAVEGLLGEGFFGVGTSEVEDRFWGGVGAAAEVGKSAESQGRFAQGLVVFPFQLYKSVLRLAPGRGHADIASYRTRFTPAAVALLQVEVEVHLGDVAPVVGGGDVAIQEVGLGKEGVAAVGLTVDPRVVEGVVDAVYEAVVSLHGFAIEAVFGFAQFVEPAHFVGVDFVVEEGLVVVGAAAAGLVFDQGLVLQFLGGGEAGFNAGGIIEGEVELLFPSGVLSARCRSQQHAGGHVVSQGGSNEALVHAEVVGVGTVAEVDLPFTALFPNVVDTVNVGQSAAAIQPYLLYATIYGHFDVEGVCWTKSVPPNPGFEVVATGFLVLGYGNGHGVEDI